MVKSRMDQRRTRYANRPADKPKAEPLWHFVDRASELTETLSDNEKRNHEWEAQWYKDAEDMAFITEGYTPRNPKPDQKEQQIIDVMGEHYRRMNLNRIVKDDYKTYGTRNMTVVHRGDFGPTGIARKKPDLCVETLQPGSYKDYGFDERAETEPSKARVYFARDAFEGTKNWYWTEKLISEPHKTNPAWRTLEVDSNAEDYEIRFAEEVTPCKEGYTKHEKYLIGQSYLDNLRNGRKNDGVLIDEFIGHFGVARRMIQEYARFADNCNYFGEKKGVTGEEFARTFKGTLTGLDRESGRGDGKFIDWVIVIKPQNVWKK